jgi:anthranilate phosphoribosyltransferase
MAPVMAQVFAARGDSVLLVRGEDGLDEFTTAAATRVWAVAGGEVRESIVDAVDLGLARSSDGDLRGADAVFNADVARRMFAGEGGPVRDAVLLNAAAALVARQGAGTDDLSGALRAGIVRAATAVDSGAATDLLARWVGYAGSLKKEG